MCPYFISGHCSLGYRSIGEKIGPKIRSSTSLFLVKLLKKILHTWWMTNKFSWLYQPNFLRIVGEGFPFPRWKKIDWYITLYHILFTVKEFQYTFFTFPSKQHKKSMNKFRFQRSQLKLAVLKNFRIFRGRHLCWSFILIMLQVGRCFPLKYVKNFKKAFFTEHLQCVLL